MYYLGADARTRQAIEQAQRERAKAVTAFWTALFATRFARRNTLATAAHA